MGIENALRKCISGIKKRRRQLIQGLIITGLAALASATLGSSAIGRFISSGTIDLLTRRAALHKETRVVLINITEGDYESIFDRRRPLYPLIILKLVQAAVSGGARTVGIDIATEDWPVNSKIDEALASLAGTSTNSAAIVWARNFTLQESRTRDVYIMQPLLGGSPAASRECYGLPALAEEAGIVRWFSDGLEANSVYQPSFVRQILYRSTEKSCLQSVESDELRLISFSASIATETAGTLILESNEKDWGRTVKPYLDTIVIIGGSFHEGGDVRRTPVGPRSGLEITGQAVASALNGEARSEVGETWSVVIDTLIGVAVVTFGLIGRRTQHLATSIAAAVAIIGMWFLWRQYYLFLSFVPIFIGLIAHSVLEKSFAHTDAATPELKAVESPAGETH